LIEHRPGKAFLDMLGVFVEFETNLLRERQLEGIAKAKKACDARMIRNRHRPIRCGQHQGNGSDKPFFAKNERIYFRSVRGTADRSWPKRSSA
jgi:DNA invertase Pin-like site-specific DNA recombinase